MFKNLLLGIGAMASLISNAQEVKYLNEFKAFSEERFVGGTSDKIVFFSQTGSIVKSDQHFIVVDINTSEISEYEHVKLVNDKQFGYAMGTTVKGGNLIQLVQYISGPLTSKCKVGLVQKDVHDPNIILKTEIFEGDYFIMNAYELPNVQWYFDGTGFFIRSLDEKKPEHNFIRRYDFDLNLIYEVSIDFLGEEASIGKLKPLGDGRCILPVSYPVSKKPIYIDKGRRAITPSELSILAIDTEGKSSFFAPEVVSMVYTHSDYFFDEKNKELIGVYLINELPEAKKSGLKGQGYAYLRWDTEGKLVVSEKHMFTYGELWTGNGFEFLEKHGISAPKPEESFPQMASPYIEFFEGKSGEIVLGFTRMRTEDFEENDPVRALMESWCFIGLNRTGQMDWVNYFAKIDQKPLNQEVRSIVDDKLLYFYTDLKLCIENNTFIHEDKKGEVISAVARVNLDNGDIHRTILPTPKLNPELITIKYVGTAVTNTGMYYVIKAVDKKEKVWRLGIIRM